MKHPGFFRLISALYMLAPFLRLVALLDLGGLELGRFGGRDLGLGAAGRRALRFGDRLLRLQDRGKRQRGKRQPGKRQPGKRQRGAVAEQARRRPAGQAQRDERHADVERLQRSADLRASARRARGRGSPFGKPGQTACSAPREAGQHWKWFRAIRLVRPSAPSTARLPHMKKRRFTSPLKKKSRARYRSTPAEPLPAARNCGSGLIDATPPPTARNGRKKKPSSRSYLKDSSPILPNAVYSPARRTRAPPCVPRNSSAT